MDKEFSKKEMILVGLIFFGLIVAAMAGLIAVYREYGTKPVLVYEGYHNETTNIDMQKWYVCYHIIFTSTPSSTIQGRNVFPAGTECEYLYEGISGKKYDGKHGEFING